MIDQKFFLKSKTVWGILIMAAPQVASLAGVDFSVGDANELDAHVQTIATAVGGLLAFTGRKTASAGITFRF